MKVLITGGNGFLGSVLTKYLRSDENYKVITIDNNLYNPKRSLNECVDFRDFSFSEAKKIDAVIHLAGVSTNYDPPEKYYQNIAMSINYKEAVKFAFKAKNAGVERFIFASTCSVYGDSEKNVDESSLTRPLTAYGKSKLFAEKELLLMGDDDFHPIIPRMVTIFGLSDRMRFDVLVNNLIASYFLNSKIILKSDGLAVRPQIHVKDVCKIYKKFLEEKISKISGEIINVGREDYNIQIIDFAKIIANYLNCKLIIGKEKSLDLRSYKVKFSKLKKMFNDVLFEYDVTDAVDEIYGYLEGEKDIKKLLKNPYFYNLSSIEYIIKNKIVNKRLRYRGENE